MATTSRTAVALLLVSSIAVGRASAQGRTADGVSSDDASFLDGAGSDPSDVSESDAYERELREHELRAAGPELERAQGQRSTATVLFYTFPGVLLLSGLLAGIGVSIAYPLWTDPVSPDEPRSDGLDIGRSLGIVAGVLAVGSIAMLVAGIVLDSAGASRERAIWRRITGESGTPSFALTLAPGPGDVGAGLALAF